MKRMPINPKDKTFSSLMRELVESINKNDKELLEEVKSKFSKAEIVIFYRESSQTIRLIQAGGPAIDFKMSQFE